MSKQRRTQPVQQHQPKTWSTPTSCPLCDGQTMNDIDHRVCLDCGSRCKPNPARSMHPVGA